MRLPTRPRQRGLNFDITPLIDVVFNLIIFFLAASHLASSESVEPVDLPHAKQTEDERDQNPRRLVITITAAGQLRVAGREVNLQQIEQMILAGQTDHAADFEVRIRSDERVPYRDVEPILLACARFGVRRIGFAVSPHS
jgi:biopolymer transport protein ExbD